MPDLDSAPEYDRALTLSVRTHPTGLPVLSVSGDLDFRTAPLLRKSLDGLPMDAGSTLVVDLSGVGYCDSTGIAVLVIAHRRTRAASAALALAGADAELTRILGIVGLDQTFALYATVDQAVAAAAAGSSAAAAAVAERG
ncbi:STAS domain-containing protein [Streptacidiphilus sp. PAMC 29251]